MLRYASLVVTLVFGPLGPLTAAAQTPPNKPNPPSKSRSFRFTYRATVTGLPPGKLARIWLPVPPSNEDQTVPIVAKHLPADGQIAREPKFGNEILYVEAKAGTDGTIPLEVIYQVTRREVRSDRKASSQEPERIALDLEPNAKVPLSGKPLELIKDKTLPMDQLAAARVLYDIVNNHMRYSKEGTGWGHGDAVWACESGYGNCSDFHSLFLSLARSQNIPARFEIGFPLPPQRGAGEIPGYHCWAKFHPQGDGWVPVDISEANKNPKLKDYYFGNLTENRLMFSAGRDLDLVPKQNGPPLNFFVYPYVEVDGKPYAADKIIGKFSYQDVPAHSTNAASPSVK
jgi:transglutaminase-like putative cysteine protease